MSQLELKNIIKRYGDKEAVHGINLSVAKGEFISLLGPSGCGKSTTLRMIAGLEDISDGELVIEGKVVNHIEPKDRDIAMVFQNYALYPHMSVYDNMAYGLKVRKTPKEAIKQKIDEIAKILGLENFLDRRPNQLSGGQRQRVAIGRAMARSPKIFLFDEPLSNLDTKLRNQMRIEIKKLHKKLGVTSVYVTHDQVEAMTLSDRIVLLKDGYVEQIGTPDEIYNNPSSTFVAKFMGQPAMNILEASVENGVATIADRLKTALPFKTDAKNISIGFRPEKALLQNTDGLVHIALKTNMVENLGFETIIHASIEEQNVAIKIVGNHDNIQELSDIYLKPEDIYFFDTQTGKRLTPQ